MAQFTIELPEKSAGILAKAATDAGLSSEEFLARLAEDALAPLEVPSAKGYLALQVLDQCKADPSRKVGLKEILAAWNKSSGNADPGDVFDGLKDLAEKQFVRVVDTDVTILEKGYALIAGPPVDGQGPLIKLDFEGVVARLKVHDLAHLVLAAAAYLHFMEGTRSFGQADLLRAMKGSPSAGKFNLGTDISDEISAWVPGMLVEIAPGQYSLAGTSEGLVASIFRPS